MEANDSLQIYKLNTSEKILVPVFHDSVRCGNPTEIFEFPEMTDLRDLVSASEDGETFVGIVNGDSMVDLGYTAGDAVVINKEKEAREGSIVVAYLDGEFTMKVFHHDKKKKMVTLYPANPEFQPIEIDLKKTDFRVWGVVVKHVKTVGDGLTIIKASNQHYNNNEDDVAPPKIDERELRKYFKASFKGFAQGSIDSVELLCRKLDEKYTPKTFAIIASMIYNCPYMTNRPATFSEWYRKFCSIVGCEYKPSYKQSKLQITKSLMDKFYFLT